MIKVTLTGGILVTCLAGQPVGMEMGLGMDKQANSENVSAKRHIFEELGRFRDFDACQTIIDAEVENTDVYFIMTGAVKVTNLSVGGKEIWHNILGPGTIFGEMAALTGRPRTATVIAMEPTRVAMLTHHEMIQMIRSDPDISIWLLSELSKRILDANDKLRSHLTLTIGQRVRGELLRLGSKNPGSDGTFEIEPLPNLSELARRLNTERENVSREVSSLVAKGVLKKTPKKLVILDADYLSAAALL